MDRSGPVTGRRAVAFAAALFAITLNFLQPLAHAALLGDGGPMTMARAWGVFCLPAAEDETEGSIPDAGKIHECCLGLAHATAMVGPSTIFSLEPPVVRAASVMAAAPTVGTAGIRDGPHQARAPPLIA
ncbi:DUF2946 family protein [Reyranella sp.]|uniref:DUF2946 family protein n=1 Tax=Reyranella sp. TaxID=1929291 RepID=UPI003BA9118A